MSKQKTKDLKTTLKTWEDVDDSLSIIADAQVSLNRTEAQMNAEILKIQKKYEPDMNHRSADILKEAHNIELFCNDHKEDFDEKRTRVLNYGKVMFRLGTPKLKTLKGFTWDAVKNLIKASRKMAADYLRTKVDIDKQALLKAELKPAQMQKIGIQIVQEESFAYEPFLKEVKSVA